MNIIKDFFISLGFDFKRNLESREVFFEDSSELNKKIENSFYFYENPNQTNTSFYLITTELSSSEIESVRKFIWNESKADLVFYTLKPSNNSTLFREDFILELHYAKATPKVNIKETKIDSFYASQRDLEKINNISKWQFDSGAFWLNYNI
ncbi:MAG TPA: hypothetical protein VFI29_12200, partial [Hanamia sp.]|nr:hypothetical protein [Hanamia sp.]